MSARIAGDIEAAIVAAYLGGGSALNVGRAFGVNGRTVFNVLRRHSVPSRPTGHPAPFPERFWAKINKSAESDGCWTWTGSTDGYGYGTIWLDGRSIRAHRVAWTLSDGPIPDGLLVLHRCDNPPCCNRAHLFLGTDADNAADKVSNGRQARGPKHRTGDMS